MFLLLTSKKVRSWCLFDFGISSYPTLILTFFYGAFYAKKIALNPTVGTTLWGFALSSSSIICFLILSFFLIRGKYLFKQVKIGLFKLFFYLMIFFTFGLILFDEGSNTIWPLIFVVVSFVSFEITNLFYNISLFKIKRQNRVGALSNLGWAFGYLGGLISLFLVYLILKFTTDQNYTLFNVSIFKFIGPFVALWSALFGLSLFRILKNIKFCPPDIYELQKNFKSRGLTKFLISYFFFNNAVISIFAFASMIAAFIFELSESQILFLGVFINLFGILGCLALGKFEDSIGSLKTIIICILSLLTLTIILFFVKNNTGFWIIALLIGFFIGPIQASSRSFLVKNIKSKNELSAFSLYSVFGNLCSILGPFIVGLTIDFSGSIRLGILVIPVFFFLSMIPYLRPRFSG